MEVNSLLDQFRKTVQNHSGMMAVCDDQRSITYAELDERSDQIAYKLRASGITKGSRVGLLGNRSTWFIEGFMGILKAGAVYVPLDPTYPINRLKYMILASETKTILADIAVEPLIHQLKNEGIAPNTLFINSIGGLNISDDLSKIIKIEDKDTAIILFTSGSTGNPKGVELAYAGFVNNFKNMQNIFNFNEKTRIAHIASPCFDISLTELWMPLLFGAKIYIASDEIKKNPWLLAEWIQKNEIDAIQFVPSLFHHFILAHESTPCRLPTISHLLFIGEALRSSSIKKWFDSFAGNKCRVYNLYGPVEASIEVCCYSIASTTEISGDCVPIGKPFKGVDFYIFDSNNQLITAPNKEGMLFIGGPQLAKGYLDSEQTHKAFKFSAYGRIYETGDIVKRLPNGDFLYLGRSDRQVKIRGFRIEMSEIEEALTTCRGIKHSAVIVDKSNDEAPILIGFVTGNPSSVEQIKTELGVKLPSFMIPHKIMIIDAMPLNSNGKMDYKTLQTYA